MKDNNKKKFNFKFGTTEIVIIVCTIVVSIFLNKIAISANGYYYIELPKNRSNDMVLIKKFTDNKILLFKYHDEKVMYEFLDENASLISKGIINHLFYNSKLSYHQKDDNLSFLFKEFYNIKKSKYLENNWSKK